MRAKRLYWFFQPLLVGRAWARFEGRRLQPLLEAVACGFNVIRLGRLLALAGFSLGMGSEAVRAQVKPTPMTQVSVDVADVPAPVWTAGQWWRLRVTTTHGHPPRTFLRRVLEVRSDGYVLQIVNESSGVSTGTSLVSKETNFITNAVEGYPVPTMIIEALPQDARLKFPLKVGAQWERRYELSNNRGVGLPTVVRGHVTRTVELDSAFGRVTTYQIETWWQSEGAVAYQATCMYLPMIGSCLEYRSGLQTSRVIETGVEK